MIAYLAIDEGCQECGVSTEILGVKLSKQEAEKLRDERIARDHGWREEGQSIPNVYVITIPDVVKAWY